MPALKAVREPEQAAVKLKAAEKAAGQPGKPDDVVNRYQVQQALPQVGCRREPPWRVVNSNADVKPQQAPVFANGYNAGIDLYAATPPAQGFASLDVELPKRGQVYRFTTTRAICDCRPGGVATLVRERFAFRTGVLGHPCLGGLVRLLRNERVESLANVALVRRSADARGSDAALQRPAAGHRLIAMVGGLAIVARALRDHWLTTGECSAS